MDEPKGIDVLGLTQEYLADVVQIHQAGLGYTLNSQLGADHLRLLYRLMAKDPSCYVGVALLQSQPVGVITGTVDADRLKAALLRTMGLRRLVSMALNLVLHPVLVLKAWQMAVIARPIHYDGHEVPAVLTAVAVRPGFQGQGVGERLVQELEGFFARAGVLLYRLDTLEENTGAARFYKRLGFEEVDRRAGSLIMIRKLTR